jgi:serine/threonine-protein kinase
VLLYEMVSGMRPVEGEDPRVIAARVERGEVKPLVHALPTVPPPLAGFVHRAMAARPEMRFQSANEMRLALDKLVGHDAGGTLPLPLVAAPVDELGQTAAAPSGAVRTEAPHTIRGTPIDHNYGPPPSLDSIPPPPPVRSSAIPLIALAVLLGASAIVAIALAQRPRAGSSAALSSASVALSVPPAGSLAVVTAATTDSVAADSAPSGLRRLSRSGPVTTPTQATTSRTTPSARPDAGSLAADLGLPTSIPLPLPSGLPSAIPTEFQLPRLGP